MEGSLEKSTALFHVEEITTLAEQNPELLTFEKSQEKLHQLFIIFSDYSIETGGIFIKQSVFQNQIIKETIIGTQEFKKITQNEVNLIISREMKSSKLSNIEFNSFINLIVCLLFQKDAFDFSASPKLAIQNCISQIFLPFLNRNQIEQWNTPSFEMIRSMAIDEESLIILKSISKSLQTIFRFYCQKHLADRNIHTKDPKLYTKPILHFLLDFEISPLIIKQKYCYLVWYFTAIYQSL